MMDETAEKVREGGEGRSGEEEEDEQEQQQQQLYGIKSCSPGRLQGCNNHKVALVWLCWLSVTQGFAVNGVNNVNTTSMERRFNMASSTVGLISSAYDFSAGIFVLPITFFCARAHHPRMLAIAAIFITVGSFVMTIPHFTTGLYDIERGVSDDCDIYGNGTDILCAEQDKEGLSKYLYVFMFGQFLHGVGGTTIYTIGVIYLDDNVLPKSSPFYQGLFYSVSTLGPTLGYVLGGRMLSYYVDFDKVETDNLTISPEDPRWVGAWWVSYVFTSVMAFAACLLLLPYPRETPLAKVTRKLRVSMAHHDGSEAKVSGQDFGRSIRDLPLLLSILLKNPVNMLLTAAGVSEGILISGFMTFSPKFMQNQFGLTAGMAAMLTGIVSVPGATSGQLFGGYITKRLQLQVGGMLRLCVGLCLGVVATSFFLLADCGSARMAGVTVPYGNSSSELLSLDLQLSSPCNEHCHCTTRNYEPICGMDGVQYFSPCHAGCETMGNEKAFSNCSCFRAENSTSVVAIAGKCSTGCYQLWIFLPVYFIVNFITHITFIPALMATLRCIPENTRSFGLGMKWMFIRFLGTVPGPVLFGVIFDNVCTVWQRTCSEDGACWIYDNQRLGIAILLIVICLKLISAFFFGMGALCYRAPPAAQTVTAGAPAHNDVTNDVTSKRISGNVSYVNGGAERASFAPAKETSL